MDITESMGEDSDVIRFTFIFQKRLSIGTMNDPIICPKCGKKSVTIQNPDQYEYWLTCSDCDYFQGMSHDDWHRIHNSPHLEDKLRKMYEKEHGETKVNHHGSCTCLICHKTAIRSELGPLKRICKACWYKIGIIILVLMVIVSYSIWLFVL